MDERQHRIERRDRFQEPDRRDGVDGYDLDHPGLAGREIDRAVNIDPLAPARLFDRELLLSWCPAAGDNLMRKAAATRVLKQRPVTEL